MRIILFEDQHAANLYPISLSRPVFSIQCGSFTWLDWVRRLNAPIECLVRPHLRAILQADHRLEAPVAGPADEPVLYLNAALVPARETFERVAQLAARNEPCVVARQERVAAALLAAGSSLLDPATPPDELVPWLRSAAPEGAGWEPALLDYPHDVVRHHLRVLGSSLEFRLAGGGFREIADGVFAAEGATLGQHVVTDTSRGPIVLDRQATIGPHGYLSGPVYVGRQARVLEHAAIKDAVSLGHTTKIGGEVEASIVEAFTNKQHHGFLGHSYLGSWINLGAGTCNSDLKNTYGTVNMDYQGHRVATGMQFVGTFVGDYAKTAINTSIFTGKTIGVCSMVYGYVTTNVASFVNYARLFGQVTETPVKVLVETQARMFARRNVTQRPCDSQLLYDMYELTRHERQIGSEALML